MNLVKACAVLMLILVISSGLTSAAGTVSVLPTDRPVTLKECIDYALREHGSVLSAEQNLAGSRANLNGAKSGYWPRIVAGSDFSSVGSTGGSSGPSSSNGTQSVLGVSQTLYDGGRTQTSVRQASASERESSANLDLTRQERVLTVTTAYFDALLTKRLADIATEAVSEAQEQHNQIQARIDAGDAANIDIYPVDVQLANSKLGKLQADNSARVAASALRNAVGLDRGPDLQLVDVSEPSSEVPAEEDCIRIALRDRPELASSTAQIDSSKASLSLARLEGIPVPSASATYGHNLGGAGFDNDWTIGVGVSMTVFDGGAVAANIQGARAGLESNLFQDQQTRKDVATEVEQAYLNLTSALQVLEASRPNVTLAKTNLDVAHEKYAQGLGIPLEIVTAEVSYQSALASNAQALYDSYVARAQLDKAIGKRGY